MTIDEIINQTYQLPNASKELLKSHVNEVRFSKGHILMKSEKIEKSIFFMRQGIVRAFTQTDDKDITFWFGKEGKVIMSMKSYVLNQKGYEDIELLEDSDLFEIKTDSLRRLFKEDIHIANWGRILAEQELVETEERLISQQFGTAKERYKKLLDENSDLIQRVQLGHIASYLGITQVSLSRIRAEIK